MVKLQLSGTREFAWAGEEDERAFVCTAPIDDLELRRPLEDTKVRFLDLGGMTDAERVALAIVLLRGTDIDIPDCQRRARRTRSSLRGTYPTRNGEGVTLNPEPRANRPPRQEQPEPQQAPSGSGPAVERALNASLAEGVGSLNPDGSLRHPVGVEIQNILDRIRLDTQMARVGDPGDTGISIDYDALNDLWFVTVRSGDNRHGFAMSSEFAQIVAGGSMETLIRERIREAFVMVFPETPFPMLYPGVAAARSLEAARGVGSGFSRITGGWQLTCRMGPLVESRVYDDNMLLAQPDAGGAVIVDALHDMGGQVLRANEGLRQRQAELTVQDEFGDVPTARLGGSTYEVVFPQYSLSVVGSTAYGSLGNLHGNRFGRNQ